MNKVSYGAWGATIIWIGIIGWVAYSKRAGFATMELNTLGDFLAGTVSPLALIWLVAGYLQQGKELNLNTQALKEQQEELRQQVIATKLLAEHSESSAQATMVMAKINEADHKSKNSAAQLASKPNLSWSLTEHVDGSILGCVRNSGGPIFDIKACNLTNDLLEISSTGLVKGEMLSLKLDGVDLENDVIKITYRSLANPGARAVTETYSLKNQKLTRIQGFNPG